MARKSSISTFKMFSCIHFFIKSVDIFEKASRRSEIFLSFLKTLFSIYNLIFFLVKKKNTKRLCRQNIKNPLYFLAKKIKLCFASYLLSLWIKKKKVLVHKCQGFLYKMGVWVCCLFCGRTGFTKIPQQVRV